ncbi:MAG: histidine kinase, partial [Cellulosimicrobium funkei]
PPGPAPADVAAGATPRTPQRLPAPHKTQAETAAARDGVSVNTWLVRAVAAALEQSTGRPAAQARPQQRGSARVTGWVR